jgi:hypothetical protein
MRINVQDTPGYVDKRTGAAGKPSLFATESSSPPAPTPVETASPDVVRQHASEIERLRDILRQHPEIRAELVAEVRQRLNSGLYHSRQAAEETAGAILRSILS